MNTATREQVHSNKHQNAKLTLSRSTALQVLGKSIKTCDVKNRDSIYAEFVFSPDDKGRGLVVVSHNPNADHVSFLPCDTVSGLSEDAKFGINAQTFLEVLRSLQEEKIELKFSGSGVQISAGSKKTQVTLATTSGEEYSPMQFAKGAHKVDCDGNTLSTAIQQLYPYAAPDPELQPLTGVFVHLSGISLEARCTDQARIASYSVNISDLGDVSSKFVIPKECAKVVSDLLSDVQTVEIEISENHGRFTWEDNTYICSLETTDYPIDAIDKFIFCEDTASATVSKADTLRSIKLANIVSKDSEIVVKLSQESSGGVVTLSSDDEGAGRTTDDLRTQNSEGEGEVHVDCKHLMQAVDSCVEPWINIVYRDMPNGKPTIVVVDGNGAAQFVLFPTRRD
jgi:DNA polymerase III sliding clamp (beta) subunit (PCNA family)